MALFFTKAILENKPIKIFNNGNMIRDFTYIDDVIQSIIKLIPKNQTKMMILILINLVQVKVGRLIKYLI